MREIKGTFTIEAAILVPMIVFAMAKGINLSIGLHNEVRASAQVSAQVRKFHAMELIQKERFLGEWIDGDKT